MEWRKHGRPLTQKQLAGLLAPFHIISLTVHPPGLPDGKGYRRIDFEEAWAAYCPGPNTPSHGLFAFEASKRPRAHETGTTHKFRSVSEDHPDANLSCSHAGLDAWTDQKAESILNAPMAD